MKYLYLAFCLVCMSREAYNWTALNTSETKPIACDKHSSILYGKTMVVFGASFLIN